MAEMHFAMDDPSSGIMVTTSQSALITPSSTTSMAPGSSSRSLSGGQLTPTTLTPPMTLTPTHTGGSSGGGGHTPDLSHLTPEERAIIENVIHRQQHEETKEVTFLK